MLRGTEQNGESWTIARLDPREEKPEVKDIAVVPFACRSLTFDGANFWSNHRAANEIVSIRVAGVAVGDGLSTFAYKVSAFSKIVASD